MKKLTMMMALAACAAMTGCRMVSVENNGEGVLTNADGTPVLVDGKVVKYSKGWGVSQMSNMMNSEADAIVAGVKGIDGHEIKFELNGLKSSPSEEFAKSLMTFAYMARIAAAMYSPGAATVPLAPEAADPQAMSAAVKAQADARAAEIAAKSARETARIKAQSDAKIAEKQAAQGAAANCAGGTCDPAAVK